MLRRALNTEGRYASPQFARGCHHFPLRYLKAIQRCSCRVHTSSCVWFWLCFDCHDQCTIQPSLEAALPIQLGASAEGGSAPAWGVVCVERCVQGGEPYQRGTHLELAYRGAGRVCLATLWERRLLINHRAAIVKHQIGACKWDERERPRDVGMLITHKLIHR